MVGGSPLAASQARSLYVQQAGAVGRVVPEDSSASGAEAMTSVDGLSLRGWRRIVASEERIHPPACSGPAATNSSRSLPHLRYHYHSHLPLSPALLLFESAHH